jgi:hypothetical protein
MTVALAGNSTERFQVDQCGIVIGLTLTAEVHRNDTPGRTNRDRSKLVRLSSRAEAQQASGIRAPNLEAIIFADRQTFEPV